MKIIRPIVSVLLVIVLLGGLMAFFQLSDKGSDNGNPNTGNQQGTDNGGGNNSGGNGNNGNGTSTGPATPVLQMIEQLQENIRVLTAERDSVVEELLNSQLSNELKEQLIADLENNVANLQIYVRELNNMILDLQAENAELKAYIVELEEIRDSLLQACYAFEQLIETLNQGLLESRFAIVFMFNDTIYSVQMIPVDGKIQIENPVSTDYVVFLGWSLSLNGALINLADITVTEDMTFYAVITRKYNVNFVYENTSYANYIVEIGKTRTATKPSDTSRKIFLGWTLDGVTVIDPATRPIYEHTTWFAKIETRYYVVFAYKRNDTITNISTQYAATASNITVPTAPTFAGYNFGGWTLNQSAVSNPKTIALNGDVIFFAKYTATNQSVASVNLPAVQYTLNQNRVTSGGMYIDRVFINLDGLIDGSSPLDSLTVTVQAGLPNGTRTYKVTLTSFHDICYEASYSSSILRVYCLAVYHKSNAVVTSGIPAGTNIICFETWVEASSNYQSPDNISVKITAISYKFSDNFKY